MLSDVIPNREQHSAQNIESSSKNFINNSANTDLTTIATINYSGSV